MPYKNKLQGRRVLEIRHSDIVRSLLQAGLFGVVHRPGRRKYQDRFVSDLGHACIGLRQLMFAQ